MKIEYRKQIDSDTAPWLSLTNVDELQWNGVYSLRVSNDDGSHNLPFRLRDGETVTLVVKDHSHPGKLQGNRTIVQEITHVDRATGCVSNYSRFCSKVNGKPTWSNWTSDEKNVITWSQTSHIDTFTTAGIYNISGERTNAGDGLPFANSNQGHTFHARLVVLDSSINDSEVCVTQILMLSNRVGGDGNVYVRTGNAASKDELQSGEGWEPWGKLQQNIEVGQIASLDSFVDNGIYSGAYTVSPTQLETFVMVVINNYAVAAAMGEVRNISQFKYALNINGNFSYKTRTGRGNSEIEWGGWVDLSAATTTDIQDGAITADKLSADLREKMDLQRNMPVIKKFYTLPAPKETDDEYQKIEKVSLNILGQYEDYFRYQIKNGGSLERSFYAKEYGVITAVPVHFVSYVYSEKAQKIEYQLFEVNVGYLQNFQIALKKGWNKLELEHTFETLPQNLLYLYLGKVPGNDFYYYKTFVYNSITKTNVITEHTNDELDSRLAIVENISDALQVGVLDNIIYDNEDLVFLGKGKTYDYEIYDIPVEEGDSFVVKLHDTAKPEGVIYSPTLRLQLYDNTGSALLDKLLTNTTDTLVTAPTGTVTLRYTFMKSTSPASVLDGEYKFNGVTLIQKSRLDTRVGNVELRVTSLESIATDWAGKVMSTYGDSITALQGGDFDIPYNEKSYRWGNRVANYLKMSKHYGRGIGGQKYAWGTNGGAITWVYKETGVMYDRYDSFNLDSWDGTSFPSAWTDIQKNIVLNGIAEGSIMSIRGCLCSWSRITAMYPASIKDTVDVVFVMCHNDSVDGKEFVWVKGDTTDPEWALSEQYATYGGDYNISTLEGGIASTIMKLQAWMPNAVIILGTPINGQGTTGQLRPDANGLYKQVEHVKNVGLRFSIPVIDVYATCGINGLNRTEYITDTIHPYSVAGSKMIARAIIGGFKTILPNGVV